MSLALRLFAAVILIGLLVLLLGPSTSIEQGVIGLDKVAHFLAFGLVLWAFGVLLPRQPRVLLAVLAVALGGLVEAVQGQIGRDASWFDLLADAAGVAAALLLWSCWRGFRPRSSRQIGSTRS